MLFGKLFQRFSTYWDPFATKRAGFWTYCDLFATTFLFSGFLTFPNYFFGPDGILLRQSLQNLGLVGTLLRESFQHF